MFDPAGYFCCQINSVDDTEYFYCVIMKQKEMAIMWILYAAGSSFFAGITAILAKCGIKKTDSDVATAIRTVVVLIFSWLMVMITGTWTGITNIRAKTLLFLILSYCLEWQPELPGYVITEHYRMVWQVWLYRSTSLVF